MFSGIGNVHAVNDAFEELRNALDPAKMESRLDRWKGDAERWKSESSGSIIERTVSSASLKNSFRNSWVFFRFPSLPVFALPLTGDNS